MKKQELQEYYWLKRNVLQLEQRLSELQSLAERKTTQFSKAPRMSNNQSDRIGDILAQIEEVRLELKQQLRKSYEMLYKIEKAIEELPEREKYLIRARYIELRSWEQIAVDMNYSWRGVHKIHAGALKMLAS